MAFQRRLTTQALIEEVRQLIDESNTDAVADSDILASLNRGQDRVGALLARHYRPPMLRETLITPTGATDYPIPEDAFEQRIQKIEWQPGTSGYFEKLTEIDVNDIGLYESPTGTGCAHPGYYCIIGDSYRLLPGASTGRLRLTYVEDPLPLAVEQGRITLANVAGNYIIVDQVGEDVSAASDALESYVNIIDKNTGYVKATLQVQAVADRKLTFRTVPTRTTVQDQTVVGVMPANVESDDYICGVQGTCVPLMKKPGSNFIVQYAAAEMTKRLGGETGLELSVLSKLEEDVQRSWSGRPNTLRVKNRANSWRTGPGARRGGF